MERAETLSFQLEARVFEQAVLGSRASASGAPDDLGRQRAAILREEIASALAELTSLLPDDPVAAATAAAAADWQAAVDTKLALLAAGDLVAANRVDRAQVDPRFEQLAGRLRANVATYDDAAGAAHRRSQADSLGVAGAAMALGVVLLWPVERVRARQQAAEARAGEERSRLVYKILSVAERQRSGMAAELHDGPIRP